MIEALREHRPEYLIEAALLAIFMIAACTAAVTFQHPRSPVAAVIRGPLARRICIGTLMGLTAIALIYSPWGARSGAHMNPSVTLTYFVLGKVGGWDTVFYVAAQFAGGLVGCGIAARLLDPLSGHESVNHAVTLPGRHGFAAAWLAEFLIAFCMMSMVLVSTNHAAAAPYTGLVAGAMIASFIVVEAPLSGMSMNPARTLGSAVRASLFRGLWIYFSAPPLAMLAAAWVYTSTSAPGSVYCAKLNHSGQWRCIFHCRIDEMPGRTTPGSSAGIR